MASMTSRPRKRFIASIPVRRSQVYERCQCIGRSTPATRREMIPSRLLGYTLLNTGHFFENAMSSSGDDNPDSQGAQHPPAGLQRQNERLQLLLNLTSRITSNLDLREVLRAISANFREVMRCDGAGIWLPGQEAGTFKLYAFDAPVSKGFAKEEVIITLAEDDPARRAFETMKPMVATVDEIGWPGGGEGYRIAAAEGVKSACFIPLVNRGRALGDLMIVRLTEGTFTAEDVDFLSQAAGQIAIAIENALAYREISELKDKLAQEKLYLEEEIRSEMDFEQIVGK